MSELPEKTYLELSDHSQNAHKFYEVSILENQIVLRFGRIGDKGQTQLKTYESAEKAKQEAKKKIKEKLNKGYKYSVSGKTKKKAIQRSEKSVYKEQLRNLADCGIKLYTEFPPEILLEEWSEEDFEDEPYEMLLVAMGAENEFDEYGHQWLSDNVWHFDTECIEDHGDYIRIAERMRDLAGGDLPLKEINDYVNIEEEIAWLEFILDDEKYHWNLKIEDDWVDTDIFGMFITLLAKHNSNKRFTYFDLDGQDCLIGCMTVEELKKLRQVTNLNFVWLS